MSCQTKFNHIDVLVNFKEYHGTHPSMFRHDFAVFDVSLNIYMCIIDNLGVFQL